MTARAAGRAARAEARTAWALVAPAAALLGAVALLPVLAGGAMSLGRIVPVLREARFVGLANWRALATDERFWGALARTAAFTGAAVALELALALPLALVLHRAVRGRGLLRASVLLPWAIPTAVTAKLWAWILEPGYGLVARLGPASQPNWLGSPGLALGAAVVVDVWKTTPFVALLLLAGLQSIPEDVYASAAVDGASPARTFRRVTLPLLAPSILLAAIFRSLDAFRVFDAVFVLTGGGPANTTETLSIYAYAALAREGDLGYGATLAAAAFLATAALAAVLVAAWARAVRRTS